MDSHDKPLHPGEVLLKKFLEPNAVQQTQLAEHLTWTYARLNEIVNQRRGVTADSALCFAEAFATEPEFWLTLQMQWDLWHARQTHKAVDCLPYATFKKNSDYSRTKNSAKC